MHHTTQINHNYEHIAGWRCTTSLKSTITMNISLVEVVPHHSNQPLLWIYRLLKLYHTTQICHYYEYIACWSCTTPLKSTITMNISLVEVVPHHSNQPLLWIYRLLKLYHTTQINHYYEYIACWSCTTPLKSTITINISLVDVAQHHSNQPLLWIYRCLTLHNTTQINHYYECIAGWRCTTPLKSTITMNISLVDVAQHHSNQPLLWMYRWLTLHNTTQINHCYEYIAGWSCTTPLKSFITMNISLVDVAQHQSNQPLLWIYRWLKLHNTSQLNHYYEHIVGWRCKTLSQLNHYYEHYCWLTLNHTTQNLPLLWTKYHLLNHFCKCFLFRINSTAWEGHQDNNLFVGDHVMDDVIHRMIEHSQSIAFWVAAEVLCCSGIKVSVRAVFSYKLRWLRIRCLRYIVTCTIIRTQRCII